MRERGPDRLRAGQVVALRGSIQRLQLLRSQTDGNHLRWLRATPWPSTSPALQLGGVVAGFSLLGPLPDLVLIHHTQIV